VNETTEWKFENAVNAVVAQHSSGFSVRLPCQLGVIAKVLAVPAGISKRERSRLIVRARAVFKKIHGRETWERKRRNTDSRPARERKTWLNQP
jgi:hypothetical protein